MDEPQLTARQNQIGTWGCLIMILAVAALLWVGAGAVVYLMIKVTC